MAITVESGVKPKPTLLQHTQLIKGKLYHAHVLGDPNGALVLATNALPVVLRHSVHSTPTSVGVTVNNTNWEYSPADDVVVTIQNEA